MSNEPDKDLLWKQYELHVGLYKHYLELVLKFNVFYYAGTGAILSYFFSKTDVPLIKYSLLFPIIMSLGFAILFIYGAFALRITRQDVFDLRDKLGLETAPELNVLAILLAISASMMVGVAVVIFWLFLRS
jgi:hypothetical protein